MIVSLIKGSGRPKTPFRESLVYGLDIDFVIFPKLSGIRFHNICINLPVVRIEIIKSATRTTNIKEIIWKAIVRGLVSVFIVERIPYTQQDMRAYHFSLKFLLQELNLLD